MSPRPEVTLTPLVIAWRVGHGIVAVGFLGAIAYVWSCAIRGRRGRYLAPAVGSLAAEGLLVLANRGDCPLGGVGERIGDPVPLFELVLTPRAAQRAVPALGAFALTGGAVLALRLRR